MRRWISRIIFILSIILLSISLYFLMGMYQEDKKSENAFDNIRQIYEESKEEQEENAEDHTQKAEKVQINPGLLALHEQNPDCIGWITIEGTAIDYPVMYHPEEKNYYLRRNFEKEYDVSGTPFVAEICDPEESDNLIIYGHHMNSGAMFADLEKYKSKDFYKEHPVISFSTLHDEEEYQIIAAFTTPVHMGHDFEFYNFSDAESIVEFYEYVETCRKKSIYDTGYSAEYGDKLITLCTCEYSQKNGRMVVVGKLNLNGNNSTEEQDNSIVK